MHGCDVCTVGNMCNGFSVCSVRDVCNAVCNACNGARLVEHLAAAEWKVVARANATVIRRKDGHLG